MNRKTALITGASGGIGLALARLFARDGYNLVLTARSEDALRRLASELEKAHGIQAHVISADLTDPQAPAALYERTRQSGIHVDVLVNNAGFATYGPFADADPKSELDMLEVNVSALTHLTRLFLPAMIERRSGKVLNVASTAAFQPGPLMAVYCASKAYVLSFSEAIANELKGTGVTVTALCPGATRTGFIARAEMEKSNLFRKGVMDVETVARAGYDALMKGRSFTIPGLANRFLAWSVRFMPRSVVPSVARRVMEQAKE